MSKKFTVATLAALFAATAYAGNDFATLDTDANGAISKQEASVMQSVVEQWDTLDADANGELSATEFAGYEAGKAVSKEMGDIKGETLGATH